jgi:hypothetical protein
LFRVERWLLVIAGALLVAVALDSPIRGRERVGVHGEPFLLVSLSWVSASF